MISLENGNFFEFETIGKFLSDEIWLHPSRTIYSYELIFVLEGNVFIAENDEKYELSQNNMLILEPEKKHFGFLNSEPPVSFYWLHFRTDMGIPFKIYRGSECYDLKYLIKKLLHISNTPSYPKAAAETLALMIYWELTHIGSIPQNGRRALVGEITEWVRIKLSDNITVTDTAKHFGYNPDYLGKLFKESYGTGLKEYIAAERIKKAKDLLLTSNLSIKEIAARLGFENENLFVKFFVYHEEISPSRFRNKYFNTHLNNK